MLLNVLFFEKNDICESLQVQLLKRRILRLIIPPNIGKHPMGCDSTHLYFP